MDRQVTSLGKLYGLTVVAVLAFGAPGTGVAEELLFRAGVHAIDITPLELPVIVNGGMLERTADRVVDRLHARALVLDDGIGRIAICVVDSCMMPRSLLDEAKRRVQESTGIAPARVLISATHAHSAPSVQGCLGSDVDEGYARFLPGRIAEAIRLANGNLAPARIGWAVGRDERNVACRRWLMLPGKAPTNPFGGTDNDLARMHPGIGNPDALRPTGPVDPEVPVVSIQTRDGRPLALLSSYSLHYVGAPPLSADYFGVFCEKIAERIGVDHAPKPFVAMLANGTSGDTWLMDYTQPRRREYDRFSVAEEVARAAYEAYRRIEYHDWVPIVMEERLLELGVRLPSEEEVARAREFAKSFAGRKPRNVAEVYARETLLLADMPPTRELKLQAIRLGELGIVAIPNEVFAVTGLTIKKRSPLATTFTISLSNGSEGYIPPPDQHALGGYTTWRARTSCLEGNAELKILAVVSELLAEVDRQRRETPSVRSPK